MNLLKYVVGLLWLANLSLLIWYMIDEEINGWNITALVGVALTGIIPMLFRREGDKKRDGCAAFLHVISGVVGAAGSGLALGYASQCGKESYDNIEWLVAAAIVNGLSGIVAHYAYIDKEKQSEIYKNQSLAYNLLFTKRWGWYVIIGVISLFVTLLTLAWNQTDAYDARGLKCDNNDHYSLYLISPVVHLAGMVVLALASNFNMLQYVNFSIMHVAAILSMFGLNLTRGWGGDWLIVGSVYIYLALAHFTNRSDRERVAFRRVRSGETDLS